MTRRLAIAILGKRETGRIGYYRQLAIVEYRLKKFFTYAIVTVVAIVLLALGIVALSKTDNTGHYVPDCIDENGRLIDSDGDGDYYHWEE